MKSSGGEARMHSGDHHRYRLKPEEQQFRCLGMLRNGSGEWSPGGYIISWEHANGLYTGTVGAYRCHGKTLKKVVKRLRKAYAEHPELRENSPEAAFHD